MWDNPGLMRINDIDTQFGLEIGILFGKQFIWSLSQKLLINYNHTEQLIIVVMKQLVELEANKFPIRLIRLFAQKEPSQHFDRDTIQPMNLSKTEDLYK